MLHRLVDAGNTVVLIEHHLDLTNNADYILDLGPAARDAGVTEFLTKPISPKALYQRIVSVVTNPRPFIKTKTYFGPDRRRHASLNYAGPERRKGDNAEVIRQNAPITAAKILA